MIGERIARAARYLRVTGDGGTMSLTSVVLIVATMKVAVTLQVSVVDLGVLVLALLNSNAKKVLGLLAAKKADQAEARLKRVEDEIKSLAQLEGARQLRGR